MTTLRNVLVDWLSKKNETMNLRHTDESISQYAEEMEEVYADSLIVLLESLEQPIEGQAQFMMDWIQTFA